MTCTGNTCGTGGWNGPLPGDPSNNSILSAVGTYGGIAVSWTYPTTNPFAVAHTKVFRGIVDSFENALELRVISGNYYLDELSEEEQKRYYYWIQLVSVNGTEGEIIGPVSAIPLDYAEKLRKALADKVTFNLLDASLRSELERITLLDRDLAKEIEDRVMANSAMNAALEAVQADTASAVTYIQNEVIERKSSDSALVTAINAIAAGLDENAAAIAEIKEVTVTPNEATARAIEDLYVKYDTASAAISTEAVARASADDEFAYTLEALSARTDRNAAAIAYEATVRASENEVAARNLRSMQVSTDNNVSAINENLSYISATLDGKAESKDLLTVATTVNGHTTSIQQNIESINGIQGKYTVKIDNNGYITGFGLLSTENDGVPSSAFIVRADTFGIVMPGYGNYMPFFVGADGPGFNGTTYWDSISGSNKPENNATKGAVIGGNLTGSFNKSNINVYMPGAVIGTAQIEDAAIKSAKIGVAEIGTAKIAGNAVTVPAYFTMPSTTINQNTWQFVGATTAFNLEGGGFIASFSGELK